MASRQQELGEIARRSPAICFLRRAVEGWPVEVVSDNIMQFGYSPDELTSGERTFASIVHPDDLIRVAAAVARYSSEGREDFAQEYRILTRAGEVRWVDDRTWVRRDASGSVTHFQGIILDITSRKEAQAQAARVRGELERSLRFTESLLTAIPTPVFFKDADGRYIGCNRAFTEVMGVTSEEIRGKTVYECWPSEHARIYHQRDLELVANPALQVYEWKVKDRHGQERPVVYAKNVFLDEADKVAGIVGAFVDISEQAHAKDELRYRLEFERVVTDISTQFVGCVPDEMDEAIEGALRRLGEFTGVDRSYVFAFRANATLMDNTHEWCRAGIESHIDGLQGLSVKSFAKVTSEVLGGRARRVSRVADLPAGSDERLEFEREGILSLVMVPVQCAGRVLGFLGLDSVRAERSWSEDDVALLRVVGEIIANGLERRRIEVHLREAQKLESIGRLAAGIAHDFNNMLTPILGFSGLLLEDLRYLEVPRDRVAQILEAGQRSRELVRQLLAFSRRQLLALVSVDLNQIIADMEKLLRGTVREHIDLRISTPSHPCLVRADPGQLEQIIMNLVVNAQDAMPQGGLLRIDTGLCELDASYRDGHPEVPPGRYAFLSMTDTGCGMDANTRGHLFEPFFTTKAGGGGTGLGLATVYGIVKQHGGNIEIHSAPGTGTTVKLYLPEQQSLPEQQGVSQDRGVRETAIAEVGRGGQRLYELDTTVMVAEDDELVRELVVTMLHELNCRALSAGSGTECLALMEREGGSVNLLLTDVIMPDMNGRELFERLERTRNAEGWGPIRVLYMSGYNHDVIAHQGVLDEGVAFLQKPFTIHDLAKKLRQVMAK